MAPRSVVEYAALRPAFESAIGQSRGPVSGVASTYANGGPDPAMYARVLIGRHAETRALAELVDDVRSGQSRVLVVRAECGLGKTALLDWLAGQAGDCQVLRAGGVQAEMELAFAGLHQLLAPILPRLPDLPSPQRDALQMAFGMLAGAAPDRFFIALAVLSLLADTAKQRPLICLIDDEQWLDRASAQALAFVARRMDRESVGLIFATQVATDELSGLPELQLAGLDGADADALLDSVLTAPIDPEIRERFVIETRGNPLALTELPRSVTPAQMAGGFALPAVMPMSAHLEDGYRRRLDALPAVTRRLALLAAADPTGEPSLLSNAAAKLGLDIGAADPAIEAGLIDIGTRVQFRHPLVRTAAYRSAAKAERQRTHRALAEATDPRADPDRRAWHRAQAALAPDETVAAELENSADRALARGGVAAAAAFLERAAMLTPTPRRRAVRMLAAAKAKRDAGALDGALGLLVAVETGPLDALQTAQVGYLRGEIAFDQLRVREALQLLHSAAGRFETLCVETSREARLRTLDAAMWLAGPHGPDMSSILETTDAACAGPPCPPRPRAVDVLLDAFVARFTEGYAAAAPMFCRAIEMLLAVHVEAGQLESWLPITRSKLSATLAAEVWDADSWYALAVRETEFARIYGAPIHLQFALHYLAWTLILRGEFAKAGSVICEDAATAAATGSTPLRFSKLLLSAWRGQHDETHGLFEAMAESAEAEGKCKVADFAAYGRAVLDNGFGRHGDALAAIKPVFDHDHLGMGALVIPELVEAASRTGNVETLAAAGDWMAVRAMATPTPWALGINSRIAALSSEGDVAERFYRESLEHLGRTPAGAERARGRLIYGEWLRRQSRRADARVQLRAAEQMFSAMGANGFADRARRELLATGESARKRSAETSADLTPQELQVAGLARDGLSNIEIGGRLFISPRTVQYHLRKVFAKLGIRSRGELAHVLPDDASRLETSA
jgi:DNA-binding CsgD family transcriptional regulator